MPKSRKSLQGKDVFVQQGDAPEDQGRLSYGGCKGQSNDSNDIVQGHKDPTQSPIQELFYNEGARKVWPFGERLAT